MASSELLEQWRITEEWLRRASSLIVVNSSSKDNRLGAFDEYLSHNEFGLALEELEEAATRSPQGRRFWDAMVQAAMSMKLDDRARMFIDQWASTSGVKAPD
jgi:DNA-binding transcriptional regulator/RsmH inhibitor MraZ